MATKTLVFILIMVYNCYGDVHKLNDSEYFKMPQLYHLDDYIQCLTNPDGLYCTADIDIVSDDPSNKLLTMMRQYSSDTRKRFNYTQVHYGICMTQTCKRFFVDNKTEDLKSILEGCLNNSLWENYELKCKINHPFVCNDNKSTINIDTSDIVMAAFLIFVIIMNCVGSVYSIVSAARKNYTANKILMCFSIPHNYSKFLASYSNIDSREERLKSLHGLRTIALMAVITCHSFLPISIGPENPRSMELQFENILHNTFINGTIIVQIFFLISGCLLSYKLEMYAEKHELSWKIIPKRIITFWIRYTPSYIVVLGLITTLLRYAGSGPFWDMAMTKEIEDCRNNGWANLLYINNYIDGTQCMIQTWYVAANMHLFVIGCMICILGRNNRSMKILLTLLFIVGFVAPAVHTYYQDLDAVLLITPEFLKTFKTNSTFNNVYKRSHTNVFNFALGIVLGFLIHRMQTNNVNVEKFKKYRYLFLLTCPGLLGFTVLGSIFYMDDYQASALVKAIYAAFVKPLFGLLMAILIFGCVFKIDNVYRVILEYDGWRIPSKLSYCALLLHYILIQGMTGISTTLTSIDGVYMIDKPVISIVASYVAALVLYLLVDAPLTSLLKICLGFANEKETVKQAEIKVISSEKYYINTTVELNDEANGN